MKILRMGWLYNQRGQDSLDTQVEHTEYLKVHKAQNLGEEAVLAVGCMNIDFDVSLEKHSNTHVYFNQSPCKSQEFERRLCCNTLILDGKFFVSQDTDSCVFRLGTFILKPADSS